MNRHANALAGRLSLSPHDTIAENMTLAGLAAAFTVSPDKEVWLAPVTPPAQWPHGFRRLMTVQHRSCRLAGFSQDLMV